MTKILPLPVKKNKFGQRVADISVNDYYGQVMEEVLEAHEAANNAKILNLMHNEGCGQCAEYIGETNEAEELVDVITCCVTRFRIKLWFMKDDDFGEYVCKLVNAAQLKQGYLQDDFYKLLATEVMKAYHAAENHKLLTIFIEDINEDSALSLIINLCIERLEYIDYNEKERQKLYQAVNEKNRKRGYFED